MFDTRIINVEDRSVEAAHIMAESNRKHDRILEAISEREIKSKDRVDISLDEYLRMMKKIDEFESRCETLDSVFMKIGIPTEMVDRIDPNSIDWDVCLDHCNFCKFYRITFRIE